MCALTCEGGYIGKRPSGCYYSRRQCEAKVCTASILLEYLHDEIFEDGHWKIHERCNNKINGSVTLSSTLPPA